MSGIPYASQFCQTVLEVYWLMRLSFSSRGHVLLRFRELVAHTSYLWIYLASVVICLAILAWGSALTYICSTSYRHPGIRWTLCFPNCAWATSQALPLAIEVVMHSSITLTMHTRYVCDLVSKL